MTNINILKEWKEFQPDNIIDGRDKLPKHSILKWKKRNISDIKGLCTHQTLGNDNPVATAQYHVDHFDKDKGAPGLCYTFYIRKSGEIWWCNNIEDVTWSQGYKKRPGSENISFVGIVVGGNFPGSGYKLGVDTPTFNQLMSLMQMYKWLQFHLGFSWESLYLHSDFGKQACPGYVISNLVDAINEDNTFGVTTWSNKDWQNALVKLGYDLGSFGPEKNGVDGMWGYASKQALTKFQNDNGILVSGIQDRITKAKLYEFLKIVNE